MEYVVRILCSGARYSRSSQHCKSGVVDEHDTRANAATAEHASKVNAARAFILLFPHPECNPDQGCY